MSTYVAMIRGINVSGRNVIPMERLRKIFSDCGFDEVRTFIQSGNVVFGATASAARCVAAIEKKLERELGKPIAVIIRTPDELAAIIAENLMAMSQIRTPIVGVVIGEGGSGGALGIGIAWLMYPFSR